MDRMFKDKHGEEDNGKDYAWRMTPVPNQSDAISACCHGVRLSHVGVWVPDLDSAVAFWSAYFSATATPTYESRRRPGFRSRFLSFPHGGCQIELMSAPWVRTAAGEEQIGCAHVAIALGSDVAVDAAAQRFATAGLLLEGPRRTGDGYYEALIRTPDGTLVELTS
jgi:lactoylglutathione lyase